MGITSIQIRKQFTTIAMLLLLVCSVLGCTCDLYAGERPNDCVNTKWVCSDPDIIFTVDGDHQTHCMISGDSVDDEADVLFDYGRRFRIENKHQGEALLEGYCSFSEKTFTVSVTTDSLFDGKYVDKIITFCRYDLNIAH